MFEATHDVVERFQCAGHLQADEIMANMGDHGWKWHRGSRSWRFSGQGFADGVVEGERPLQHGVTGGVDDKGFIPSPWPVL
jgi:hypothetical protein